jgi:murein DD-endopeptidase MepM/ murein hydrolase activator NlpD
MSKALGFIFLIFFSLVAINWLFNTAGSFLAPVVATTLPRTAYGSSGLSAAEQESGSTDFIPKIDFSLFTENGSGTMYVTQGYGHTPYSYMYLNGWHNGVDLAASFGTPVYSPASGVVLATINQDLYCPHIAFGKYVALDDTTNHLVLVFSHFGTFNVSPGEHVTKGSLIGTIGPTGLETGPHLLLSIFEEQGFSTTPAHGCGPYPQGQDVDPFHYLGSTYN